MEDDQKAVVIVTLFIALVVISIILVVIILFVTFNESKDLSENADSDVNWFQTHTNNNVISNSNYDYHTTCNVIRKPETHSLGTGEVVSSSRICGDVKVAYQDIEYYTVKEPYKYQETYNEEVLYEYVQCEMKTLSYRKNLLECDKDECSCGASVGCEIRNTDVQGGNFQVTYGVNCGRSGCDNYDRKTIFIPAGSTKSVHNSFDTGSCNIGGCFCEVIPEKKKICKTVTKSKMVPRTKTITKYKEVQKSKEVTNYRIEERCCNL